jgi:hypothetical protein
MPDTFDRLLDSRPSHDEPPGQATLVVRGVLDSYGTFRRELASLWVDGRRVGKLHGSALTATLVVDAGDRRVTARLRRDESEPLDLNLKPGEQVELLCARKPEWVAHHRGGAQRVLLAMFLVYGAAGLAWLAFPATQALATWLREMLHPGPTLTDLLNRLVVDRTVTAVLTLVVAAASAIVVLVVWNRRSVRWLREHVGTACDLRLKRALVRPEDVGRFP